MKTIEPVSDSGPRPAMPRGRKSADSPVPTSSNPPTSTSLDVAPLNSEHVNSEHEPTGKSVRFNMRVMNWHQVLMRTGWIFKTESLIMPAILDLVGGSAWLRGCLPMLNRFGQSIPPLLAADRVSRQVYKKRMLVRSSITMGVVFWALAGVWQLGGEVLGGWLPLAILAIYAVFFSAMGVNQLVVSTLTGKLVPITLRGRLMQVSSFVGSLVACSCAWFLLRHWLTPDQENFTAIFGFAGLLFVASGVAAIFFREEPDRSTAGPDRKLQRLLWDSWHVLRNDKNFRLLALIAALSGMMLTLFPHYQAVGRSRLQLGYDSLVPWIIAQNLGVALFSLPAGWIADRLGNRFVLMSVMCGLCLVPPLALGLSQAGSFGAQWYWLVFGLLGLTPVSMRLFSNYTLELVDRANHAHYLGVMSMALAGPAILASLAVGVLIDMMGYEVAFWLVSGCQLVAFLLTFRLIEPRHKSLQAKPVPQ